MPGCKVGRVRGVDAGVSERARESVWDYPRRPRVERCDRRVWVVFGGAIVADTRYALRVLERGHPPQYYVPPAGLRRPHLVATRLHTRNGAMGMASHFDVRVGDRVARDAAWQHPYPAPGYEELAGFVAYRPSKMDACYLDDELVQPQEGDFFGGWVTSEIADAGES